MDIQQQSTYYRRWSSRLAFLVLMFMGSAIAAFGQERRDSVYITSTGTKYHGNHCQYLRQSKIAIAIYDAISDGYTACSVCKPNTTSSKTSGLLQTNGTAGGHRTSSETTSDRSRQCSATTKAGNRCKRSTTEANGKCWQHQ